MPIAGARCSDAHPCPSGFICTGGTCRKLAGTPTTRCKVDDDCAVGVCLETIGFCVQCGHDDDCIQGACLAEPPFQHQCGCTRGAQCATGVCHEASNTCVSCFADRQCEDGWCDVSAGVCRKNLDDRTEDAEGTGDGPPGTAEEDA